MTDEFIYHNVKTISESLIKKKFSAVELAKACLKKSEKSAEYAIYLELDPSFILKQAEESDKRRAKGKALGILDGIPVSIKDIICVKGRKISCGSRILEDFISPYDAGVIERLSEAGAVLFGRTNMDEFAMGSSTENSAFQMTRNPWKNDCVPGGSSGGAAASVAISSVPLALGSDTGGSVRQPASFCGVVGVKPTYGLVSRYGLVAFASSLDQIGTFGRSVGDAAILLSVIAGHDHRDSTSNPEADQININLFPKQLSRNDWKGLRIGVNLPPDIDNVITADVMSAFETAIEFIRLQGAEVIELKSKYWDYIIPIYYILATAEAASNLSRYDGIRYGRRVSNPENLADLYVKSRTEGFGPEVKRRILLGTFVLSAGYNDAYYKSAQMARKMVQREYQEFFQKVDVILQPTSPTTAFRVGEKINDPLTMYKSDLLTISANLCGVPAINIPAGLDTGGLPLGIQITTNYFREEMLFGIATSLLEDIPGFVLDYKNMVVRANDADAKERTGRKNKIIVKKLVEKKKEYKTIELNQSSRSAIIENKTGGIRRKKKNSNTKSINEKIILKKRKKTANITRLQGKSTKIKEKEEKQMGKKKTAKKKVTKKKVTKKKAVKKTKKKVSKKKTARK